MPWLWFAGPLIFLFLVVIFTLWPTAEEQKLRAEVSRWLKELLGGLVDEDGEPLEREVAALPVQFERRVSACGGGSRVVNLTLVPDVAYLAVRASNAVTGSNHVTLAFKLDRRAPTFVCRPLPIVDGRPVENYGVHFKDAEFMDHYVVEGDSKHIKKWLTRDIRGALVEFPDLWLRVEGAMLTLSYHGPIDAEMLDELVEVADTIFATHGIAGDVSLFGEGELPAKPGETDEEDDTRDALASVQHRITAGVLDFSLYAVGGVMLVAVLGYLPGFHPAVLFNSPDISVTEPWQGGWTTKGFGALVFVESFIVGLLALQAHLAVRRGQSVGKMLIGVRVNRTDGNKRDFTKLVLLRKWLFLAVPLAAAAAQAKPFSARTWFAAIPTKTTGIATLAIGAVLFVSWLASKERKGIHDMIAGTEVVATPRYRIPSVSLGVPKNDRIVGRRLVVGACALVLFCGLNLVTLHWFDAWFFEVHQWR